MAQSDVRRPTVPPVAGVWRGPRPPVEPVTSLEVGFAAEQPAVGFRVARVERTTGGDPAVRLHLSRSARPPAGAPAFAPFRLPDQVEAVLRSVGIELLRAVGGSLSVTFEPGRHAFPLAQGAPVQFEFGPQTRAQVDVEVRAEDDGDGRPVPVIQRLDLLFDRPVVLHNTIQALGEVRALFEDRTMGAVLRSAPVQFAWQRFQQALPTRLRALGERLAEPDQLGVILLDRVEARPRWRRRTKTWELRVAFSGLVRTPGGLTRPFRDIELPNVLLPTPHARVDRLLSNAPLVSADVRMGGAPGLAFLRAALGALRGGTGQLSIEADLPRVGLDARLVDGAEVSVELDAGRSLHVQAPFTFTATPERSEVRLEGIKLGMPDEGLVLDATLTVDHDLTDGEQRWDERFAARADLAVGPGSALPTVTAVMRAAHPLGVGGAVWPLRLSGLRLDGAGSLSWSGGALALWPTTRAIAFSGDLRTDGDAKDDRGGRRDRVSLPNGRVEGTIELVHGGQWRTRFAAEADVAWHTEFDVPAVPELSIDAGVARGAARASLRVDGNVVLGVPARNALHVDLRGSGVALTLHGAALRLGDRALGVPEGATFGARVVRGALSPTGPEELRVELDWDLHGQECRLDTVGRSVSLLAHGLRRGALTAVMGEGGRLRFESCGADGGSEEEERLYGVRWFNALLNPAANPKSLLDLVRSEDALRHVVQALAVFAPDAADTLEDLQTAALTFRRVLDREAIRQPRDAIPRPVLARLFSYVLVGNAALAPRLEPILQSVTDGRGLDVAALKAVLRAQMDALELDYEIDAVVRWLDLLVSPTEPVAAPPLRPLAALAEDPALAWTHEGLPSAGDLYRAVEQRRMTPALAAQAADLAPYLSEAQLAWLWKRCRPAWGEDTALRLRYARELKRRVAVVRAGYGGMEHAPQSPWIAQFLGEAAGLTPGHDGLDGAEDGAPSFGALGPEEVAALLQAGLATGRQSRQMQINNRLLLELMERRPDDFTRAVFVELGHQSPRALAGVLFAFLDQDQDHLQAPLDLAAFLERRLHLPVPRHADYLAGGVKARRCYTEALDELAAAILARAEEWLARKAWLQTVRHEPRPAPTLARGAAGRLAKEAKAALRDAELLSAELRFDAGETAAHAAARGAWEEAFRACRELLRTEPLAFRAPWLREFWGRNEEALRVRSVVRGYQEDLDHDRRWLHVRRGDAAPWETLTDEQALLDAVVDQLYVFPADRQALKHDPFVRLLVPPPAGRYAFTAVSAMGVITEGAQGRELEAAWRRLRERRGVQLLRADTATGRSLEYNAERVIDEVRRAKTPWGWVGYSQGCANALMAESLLRGGTPDEQALLESFVSRCLLFSAANGSAHGSSGDWKLGRALVRGERILKPYQGTYSRPALRAFYRAARAALDSRAFHQGMGGWHSLTYERAVTFHRDLQLADHATSSVTRGVCEWPWVPEALEYMWFVLGRIQPGRPQDTQVTIEDAEGRSTRVDNPWTRALAQACLPNRVQAIHHWSPLTAEIEFVETDRDLARAIYQSPKDRHVAPWIEAQARFGRIPVEG
jgi:hypothetical protein